MGGRSPMCLHGRSVFRDSLTNNKESKMEKNKMIAVIVGVLLTVAGSIFGYNYKAEVCGVAEQVEAK